MNAKSRPALAKDGAVHLTDAVVAAILLVFTVWLYVVADGFEQPADLFSQNVSPDLFPKLLLWVIGLLTITLPFEHQFLSGGRARLDSDRKIPIHLRSYLTAALLVMIVALMPYIGAALTLVAICLLLPLLWGERRLWVVLPFAVVFPGSVVFVFGVLLKVHIEPGKFGIALY